MGDRVEFYLGSMWSLRPQGVDRVLDELEAGNIPGAGYIYDDESGWFRVTCLESQMAKVQAIFRECMLAIERDVDVNDIIQLDGTVVETLDENNEWIRALKRNLMPRSQGPVDYNDNRVPEAFKQFQVTASWNRLYKETEKVTLAVLLCGTEAKVFQEESGVMVRSDVSGKMVFLGGDSRARVDEAVAKLDLLFSQLASCPSYTVPFPPTKHYLYAESSKDYRVDARYAALINPKLIDCTVFDSSTLRLGELYKTLCRTGTCLRICEAIPFMESRSSLFGPRADAVFDTSQATRQNQWFRTHTYPAKVAVIRNDHLGVSQKAEIETWVEGVMDGEPTADTMAEGPDGTLAQQSGTPSRANSVLGSQQKEDGNVAETIFKTQPARDEQELRHKANTRSSTTGGSATAPAQDRPAAASLFGSPKTRSTQDSNVSTITSGMSDLLTFDTREILSAEPASGTSLRGGVPTSRSEPPVNQSKESNDPDATFANNLTQGLRDFAQYYRTIRGRLELRIDLGRIIMTSFVPSGLAWNRPTEFSNGWHPAELVTRLNGGCVSAANITFTKILSSFGNDADFMANLKDDAGQPMWEVVETQIVYEFSCRYTHSSKSGREISSQLFIVDIDGTVPDRFTYALRLVKNRLPPLWIHCLHRHWDAQGIASFSPTLKLESSYGHFAKALLDSLSVPEGVQGRPSFEITPDSRRLEDSAGGLHLTTVSGARVRHVAKLRSRDGQSYLRLSQVEEMKLQELPRREASPRPPPPPPGGERVTLRAIPREDDLEKGKLSVWHEASISSVRGDAILAENETLPVGGEPSWTADTLDEQGVWRALYGPALAMIKKMDGVGVLVDNGQRAKYVLPHEQQPAGGGLRAQRAAQHAHQRRGAYW
ncbi:uncharacterized protein E0L32_003866 [Thyridium curvatum]|uniref:Uncharacterized protein n=1 Tax=Thyridium curvatum TaxID=1093900 RepID=A0A507B2S5_9PEZI|nr:uncharacterized protein E0L32_003866 [Thyridium curvatum]TPX16572.1 hypothetical protein E0L32_003866 [Thyridium curvatum]